jgi:class 3 adenylate cyclase
MFESVTGTAASQAEQMGQLLTLKGSAPVVDRVLTTVLFTDIVSSTQCAVALGDARWRELLARHDEVVRAQLASHGGREIKTLGDGFLATFDSPGMGIRCARAIETALEPLPIRIRAGLNAGECDLVGNDVIGLTVNIAARIGALARADEVLVSSAVRDLVLGSGIGFHSRGRHRIKGVPGRWRLFSVTAVA